MRRTFLAVALTVFLFFAANASSFAAFFFPKMTDANFWGLLYDPTTIATPTLWYKSTGVTLDTTLGQNTVASWTNVGGGGSAYNWTQTTKTQQPTYLTGQAYGYPALQFDGVDDFLLGSGGGLAICKSASSCTAFIVADWQSTGAAQDVLAIKSGNASKMRMECFANNSSGTMQLGVAGVSLDTDTVSSVTESSPYQPEGLQLLQFQIDYANKQGAIWRNDVNEKAPTSMTNMTAGNTSATNSTSVALGAFSSGGASPFKGKIYEIMLFENKVLTAYERSHIQNYFRYKYGVW